MIKKILTAVLIAVPMLLSAQTIKLGLVDTQSIITELPAFKDAQAKIAEQSQKYEDEFKKMQDEAQAKYEEFQNLAPDTPDLTKERRMKELQDLTQKLDEFNAMAQNNLQREQQTLLAPIMQQVQDAINAVGQEGGYTLIQEVGAVLYFGAPAENITDAVRARLK